MPIETSQTYRLVPRGDPGLTCDSEGAALGGIPVTWRVASDGGETRWQTRSLAEIVRILECAYGAQREEVVDRCQRGLSRLAARFEAGDLALAGIEALMLRLPTIDAAGMAKLAGIGELMKLGDASRNEPRVPPGQPDGGQWTTGGGTGASESSTGSDPAAIGGEASGTHKPAEGRDEEGSQPDGLTIGPPRRQFGIPNLNGFTRTVLAAACSTSPAFRPADTFRRPRYML